MSVWWDEQAQTRVSARAALDEGLKRSNEELDSFLADLMSGYTSRINVLILEATKKHDAGVAAKKLRLLEEQRRSEDARAEKLKQELEDAKKLKEAEERRVKEAERTKEDFDTKLKEIRKEIEKLKLLNDNKAKENKVADAELKEAKRLRDEQQKRIDEVKEVPASSQSTTTSPFSGMGGPVKTNSSTSAPASAQAVLATSAAPSAAAPAAASAPTAAAPTTAAPVVTPTASASAAAPAASPAAASSVSASSGCSAESEFNANAERIKWIKQNVREAAVKQPKEVKQFLTDAKLELRPKFGMLTNSKKQLISCRDAVKVLFQKAKENQNAIVYQYLLNLYAKLLIEQSESEANVQLQNALPLAMLTVLLWADFPELGEYVIPRFIKKCPQVIGYFCPITTELGRKRMGWKRDDDTGKYETEEQYMGRLSGICAVWACMTQSKLAAKDTKHPYNMGHSWKFMARMLNKPRESVTQVDHCLVAAWWDMTALRFSEAFGKQGIKVLELAWSQWTEGFSDPPSMRLRGLGENWKTTGKIDHAWKPLV